MDSKEEIVAAVKATDLDTLAGHINFTAGGAANPVPNVATTPLAGGQWVKGTKYPFDLLIVSNAVAPDATIQAQVYAAEVDADRGRSLIRRTARARGRRPAGGRGLRRHSGRRRRGTSPRRRRPAFFSWLRCGRGGCELRQHVVS